MRQSVIFFVLGTFFLSLSCGQKDPPVRAAREGSLSVMSDPPGAAIILNGLETGYTTPDTIDGLAIGFHTVSVDLEAHSSCTGSLSVEVLEDRMAATEFVLLESDLHHVVLGEDFTSTTCDPCCESSLVLDTLTAELPGSFVVIRYHVWWPPPGDDPFYLANIDENTDRNDYYNNLFAPRLILDGTVEAGQNHDTWEEKIDDRAEREAHINLTLSTTGGGNQGTVTARVLSCLDYSGRNLVIRFAITEDEVQYAAPNGKTVFFQVMRDFLPDAGGDGITLLPSVPVVVERTYTIRSGWNAGHLTIVVFIQDDDTREVLQTAAVPIL